MLQIFAWISQTYFRNSESYLSPNFYSSPIQLLVCSVSFVLLGVWPLLWGGNYDQIPKNQIFKPRHILSFCFASLLLFQTIVMMLNKSLPFKSFSLFNSLTCTSAERKGWLKTSLHTCVLYELLAIYGLQYLGFALWFFSLNFMQKHFVRFFVGVCCSMCIVDTVLFYYITPSGGDDDVFASILLSNLPAMVSGFAIVVLAVFECMRLYSARKAQQQLQDDAKLYTDQWEEELKNSPEAITNLDKVLQVFKDVNDVAFVNTSFWNVEKKPAQSQATIDELFDDADLLSAPFQDLISCWMNGSSNIADFCEEKHAYDFSMSEKLRDLGTANIGPIKQIKRSIAKIHRSYNGKFRLLTDLVRCSIDFKSLDGLVTFLDEFSKKCAVGSDQLAGEAVEGRVLRILRLRNRFNTRINAETQLLGGYRDIGMKLQIGFTLMANGDVKFVPCSQWSDKSCKFKIKFMVVELQLRLQNMITEDFKELHARYVQCRDLLSL